MIASGGVPEGVTGAALGDWSDMRDALIQGRVVTRIGQLGASGDDAPDIFGHIAGALLDHAGNVLVLDRANHTVRTFDRGGRYLGAFGRAGPGPSEFLDPGGLELLADGRVVVSDRGNRLKVFSPIDSGYVHTDTRKTDLVPEHLCSEGGRLFVSGWRSEDNTVIHEIPLSPDRVAHSFGRGYEADDWLVQDQLSDGPIACVGNPVRVVFAFDQLPVLRAYAADGGALVWTSAVEDYRQAPITERRRSQGQPAVHFSSEGIRDHAVSMTAVSARHILFQTMRGERSNPDQVETRSYLIDAETGQGAFITSSLPIVVAADSAHYVAMWMLPFPRIEVRALDPQTGGSP